MIKMDIAENVREIQAEIGEAAALSGRSALDITLVAATKTNGADKIREAIAAGITDCGENRVQELTEKKKLGAYEGAKLHFIGHLQRNKVKQVVGEAALIQSVDSKELVSLIGARARALGIIQDILLEINIGGEEAKSGLPPEMLDEILDFCAFEGGIRVLGLMTIPPKETKMHENVHYFEQMHKLFVDTKTKKYDNISMEILSMGMSADYRDAILSGATMIRLGSAIFGPRLLI